VTAASAARVCFVALMDATSAEAAGAGPAGGRSGAWSVEVLKGYPFADPRRNSKVPKLLIQRMFPHARYSIWADGKLQLQADPLALIAELLWSRGKQYALSQHHVRNDLEAEFSKLSAAFTGELSISKEFDAQRVAWISQQLKTYKQERFPLALGLPDTAVLVQEHTQFTNELGCNWFREILRFPHGRDQMSFTYAASKAGGLAPVEIFPKCYFVVAAREFGHQHRTGLGWKP